MYALRVSWCIYKMYICVYTPRHICVHTPRHIVINQVPLCHVYITCVVMYICIHTPRHTCVHTPRHIILYHAPLFHIHMYIMCVVMYRWNSRIVFMRMCVIMYTHNVCDNVYIWGGYSCIQYESDHVHT